jgi:hypothetical protein
MTYRDDLNAAHEEIAKLREEIARLTPKKKPRRKWPKLPKLPKINWGAFSWITVLVLISALAIMGISSCLESCVKRGKCKDEACIKACAKIYPGYTDFEREFSPDFNRWGCICTVNGRKHRIYAYDIEDCLLNGPKL